jgi:hypothetical protein
MTLEKTHSEDFTVEWTHRRFPNLMDCRPIYVRRALQAAGLAVENSRTKSMWVPVEIVRGRETVLLSAPLGRVELQC